MPGMPAAAAPLQLQSAALQRADDALCSRLLAVPLKKAQGQPQAGRIRASCTIKTSTVVGLQS